MSSGKILLGVLAGIAAGAALGILFAPDKGSNTVKKMTDKADDFVDELKNKFSERIKSVTDKFENVADSAKDLVEMGKAKMDDARHDVKSAVNPKYSSQS